MRLGGPVFLESRDPEEIARAHRAEGYRAAYCPAWLMAGDTDAIHAVQQAFERHDVVLAEVGAWGHILHPDPAVAAKNEARVIERLALADAVGARCCVDYTGSYGPEWYHPKNLSEEAFDAIVEMTRRIIDGVRPTRTVFALEMMPSVHPESADDYLRLLAAVDRPGQFGVHLDPVNLIDSPRRYYDTGAVIRECFEKLGPHIASCHAKDVTVGKEFVLHLDECRPGTGTLDYRTFLTELSRLPQEPPLMLEHLPNAEEYRRAGEYIVAVAGELGLSFQAE
jgi:sugar phosphate isomerase/epimerase